MPKALIMRHLWKRTPYFY